MDDDAFLQSLRETFTVEADELVQTMATGLLALERSPSDEERRRLIESTFRAAHSLKGAARAVNYPEIEAICEALEDVFATWKREDLVPEREALDTLHGSLDRVSALLSNPAAAPLPAVPAPVPETPPSFSYAIPSSIPEPALRPAEEEPPVAMPPISKLAAEPVPAAHPSSTETVRIAVYKLDERLREAEEMLTAKLSTEQRARDLGDLSGQFGQWSREWGELQPQARQLRLAVERSSVSHDPALLLRLIDFLDWSHDFLRTMEMRARSLCRVAEQDHLVVGKLVDDLLRDSKKMLMMPLATFGAYFPRLVRDLCRDQGKEADLVLRGEEVEVDKRILEELKDPLVHLLRNCVDHGLETPEQRRSRGKPERGTIILAVTPVNGNKVEFLLSDDGGGIDPAKVIAAALRRKRITPEEAQRLTPEEAQDLIFQSDVSTSPILTQISGRGLGLAIVRERAEKLGGKVTVESRVGFGTNIRITLPIALATFRGILVQAGKRQFIVPTTQVERVSRFRPEDIQTVENRETLSYENRAVSLVWLTDVLELPEAEPSAGAASSRPFLLLGSGETRTAFAVDSVLGEQEVLVKRLGPPLIRVRNIAGATVLGTGQVVPILNVSDLLKSARHVTRGAAQAVTAVSTGESTVKAKSILIAEDSITSRMLLKGILESAGYRVKTAVDGLEALTALRAESFDLLVSDVEMPRLNGFDLTAAVRAERKISEIPVILVTALEMREHRERGIDVGANAYLVKSSFDQSNLLEAVRRLV